MRSKMKCNVCGCRFHIIKAQVYRATEVKGFAKSLTDGTKDFDAMDCPSCGCQKILQARMPKSKKEGEDALGR